MDNSKPVVFSKQASKDFYGLLDYYEHIGGATLADRIRLDVGKIVEQLTDFPGSAEDIGNGIRRAVTPRYRFSMLYRVRQDTVAIEAIFRQQDRLPSS